jgi:hypothetical protein
MWPRPHDRIVVVDGAGGRTGDIEVGVARRRERSSRA